MTASDEERQLGWHPLLTLGDGSPKQDQKAPSATTAHGEAGEAPVAGLVQAQPGGQWAAALLCAPARCASHAHQKC